MVIHTLQLLSAELAQRLAHAQHLFGCSFAIYRIQFQAEEVLLTRPKAVASLTLKLNVLLVPACGHASAAHEVAGVNFCPMAMRIACETVAVTRVVDCAQSDVLTENAVKFLDRRAPVVPLLLWSFRTGYVSSGRARLFQRL